MTPDRSHKRQKGMSLGYWITRTVCGLFCNIGFKTRIVGVDNLPKRGSFLLVSNHVSYFDPPLISGVTPKPLHFFARKSLLKNWWFYLLHKGMNIIPADVDGNDVGAVRAALKILEEDKPLVIFPEGTRSLDGQLKPAQKGAGFIACKSRVPVVPVRVFGTFEALNKSTHKPNWGMPIMAVIGKPLYPADYDLGPTEKNRYQLAADRMMAAIAAIEKPQKQVDNEIEWAT